MVFNGISLLKCVADFVLQKQREKSYNVIDHIIDQMYSLWKVEPYILVIIQWRPCSLQYIATFNNVLISSIKQNDIK